ncbi:MAG: PDZ domain-containing protein [Verrucomicrobia bacterium]|nr:PDZ domain-containing protein [Verrucomicrobiota bacterium]
MILNNSYAQSVELKVDASKEEIKMVTFLGVETSRVSKALRNHIDIPDGVGLTIDHVAENSGAAKADLQQYDILLKVDDQIIINQEQLSTLIRSKEAGDSVKVEVLRKSKKLILKVELGEKEVHEQQGWTRDFPFPKPNQKPPFPSFGEWNLNFDMEDFQERMEEFSERAAEMGNKALQFIPEIIIEREEEDGSKRVTSVGRGPQKVSINKGSLIASMETIDGNNHYVVSEKDSTDTKVLYEGDYPVDDVMKDLPENVQGILKQLNEPKEFNWKNLEDVKKENIRIIINSGEDEAHLSHPNYGSKEKES